jgi:hypothetical protein
MRRPALKLPSDVRQLLARRFESRHRGWLTGDGGEPWPLDISLGAPSEPSALKQVDAVRAWAEAWRGWCGPGELLWSERRWRTLGTQQLPDLLRLHDAAQVAAWAGQEARWRQAVLRYGMLTGCWPMLAAQLGGWYAMLADYSDADFARLVDVLDWIIAHPASGLYPRQLPVAGIDSKWLDTRRAVLAGLVAGIGGQQADNTDFFALCGLRRPAPQVRMRLLDPALREAMNGLSDLGVLPHELAGIRLPARNVLIVENLQTGLALPDLPGTVAFMALGYGVDMLAHVPWLSHARMFYWGDIDTHGFAILNRARFHFPQLESLLMDDATMLRFRALWSVENSQHGAAELTMLTAAEAGVYRALKENRRQHQARLEQERIGWDFALEVLRGAIT